MKIAVKEWFLNKAMAESKPAYAMAPFGNSFDIVRETEKAYLLSYETETIDGERDITVSFWCPKSCTMTEEEAAAEGKAKAQRFMEGKERYAKLIEYAKANGIKGIRTGMRKETVLAKIRTAGLNYEY